MDCERISLNDACVVRFPPHQDARGFFTRIRCATEFAAHGLPTNFVQANLSYNAEAATFRGLHYQIPPSKEGKLVRCVRGAIDDIIVDIRPHSDTFLKHEWVHLAADGFHALYVPPGFAHGFITATDDATILYDMTDTYAPDLARGIRWDDPALGISLPRNIAVVNPRDTEYPDLDTSDLECFRTGQPHA